MKFFTILMTLAASSAHAGEFPDFTCKAKIFYMDAQRTGKPTMEVPLKSYLEDHPELLEARMGKLRFSANALYAMPQNKPEILLAISIFTDAKQKTLSFKARNATAELFEKGKADLVAHFGKDETIVLSCALNP